MVEISYRQDEKGALEQVTLPKNVFWPLMLNVEPGEPHPFVASMWWHWQFLTEHACKRRVLRMEDDVDGRH